MRVKLRDAGSIFLTSRKFPSWEFLSPNITNRRGYTSQPLVLKGLLVCLQPGDDSIETFPPIFVFDLGNAPLEIMHNTVDLP